MNALVGPFHASHRFDRVLEGLHIDEIGDGRAKASLEVQQGTANAFETLHGGASCTLVDVMGTLALLSVDSTRPGVSVDINISFLLAAKVGDKLSIEGSVLKSGKKLGFTEVTILREHDQKVLAVGRHTKAFV